MNVEWNRSPYFGVFPRVFNALNNAFSAPRIWTVDAGNLAKLVRDPACDISLAATVSPNSDVKFGATLFILDCKYANKLLQNNNKINSKLLHKNKQGKKYYVIKKYL